MHIMFSCSHKSNIYLQQKSFNKRYIKASRRRDGSWTTLGGLLPPSLDILGALALIRPSRHHVLDGLLPPSLLLSLPSGLLLLLPPDLRLLLPLGLLLLPHNIASQKFLFLLRLLKFFLGPCQFLF
jgi:hypothetical protein